MGFQLRRMVLVNAGTNKHVASGRITQVDPRGGAAVVGANGVGKTSTLRLIPLFFGHPTSQVVAMNQGQEGVRFILPRHDSAICFEYQRGSDRPEDLRLAVMRQRSDGSDAPEYRIYETSFRKELFVKDNRFLKDEDTEAQARSLGIKGTSKLTTADYRAVILRTGSNSKDRAKLYALGVAHSFGPRPLPNLDKLVATMVKNGVKFEELVQVAVGLIQDELGSGAHIQKLSMKQQRGDIERWLRNRDAAETAVKLEAQIMRLNGLRLDHLTAETKWRERRADLVSLREARAAELLKRTSEAEAAEVVRRQAVEAESLDRARLMLASNDAVAAASTAKQAYETAKSQQDHFIRERAEHWAQDVEQISPLEQRRDGLAGQIQVARSASDAATLEYAEQVSKVETEANKARQKLEENKNPLRVQYDDVIQSIGQAEAAALETIDNELLTNKRHLDDQRESLIDQRGLCRARAQAASVPKELQDTVAAASERLVAHANARTAAGARKASWAEEVSKARAAFDTAEQRLSRIRLQVADREAAVGRTRAQLAPEKGTLLSMLRNHADDDWKRNLARVLNPELLQRTDLDPHPVTEALADTVYGWQLETRVIQTPDWTDDEAMRAAVESTLSNLNMAKEALLIQEQEIAACSLALESVRSNHSQAQSEESVLQGRTQGLEDALDEAKLKLQRAAESLVEEAKRELLRIASAVRDLDQRIDSLANDCAKRKTAVKAEYGELRANAKRLRDDAIASIDRAIGDLMNGAETRVSEIKSQLNEHLTKAGVDVARLEGLKTQRQSVEAQIRMLTSKKPLVEAWRLWMAEVGPDKVAALRQRTERAADKAVEHSKALGDHDERARLAQQDYEAVVGKINALISEVQNDLTILEPLEEVFGSYLPCKREEFDTSIKAEALRRLIMDQRNALTQSADAIGNLYRQLRKELTSRDSTVKELVDASLQGQDGDEVTLAQALCRAYRLLGSQVINELNTTLRTVLANIGQFRKRIASFETEVGQFNKRLQEGLNEVKRFDRIEDLRLDIVSDFEGLGFYRKLTRMDGVVRQHAGDYEVDYNKDMPPVSTAEALRDFMGVIGNDGALEVNLAAHITLHGSVIENGQSKSFKRPSELENISSSGLSNLILITLLVGLVNTVRRGEPVHVPWVTDEVGKFDAHNFAALLRLLKDNRVDVITASPELGVSQLGMFAQRYVFADRGEIRLYAEPTPRSAANASPQQTEVALGDHA